jgi:hypothetical protein
MPIRIQRKRIKGWRMPENTVYVGRGTKWGNPLRVIKEAGDWVVLDIEGNYWGRAYNENEKPAAIAKAIEAYSGWIDGKIGLGKLDIKELKGKNLACFCKEGEPCHADVLLKLANEI